MDRRLVVRGVSGQRERAATESGLLLPGGPPAGVPGRTRSPGVPLRPAAAPSGSADRTGMSEVPVLPRHRVSEEARVLCGGRVEPQRGRAGRAADLSHGVGVQEEGGGDQEPQSRSPHP